MLDSLQTVDLIIRGADLKAQMSTLADQLAEVNAELSKAAEFKHGVKTCHIVEAGIQVTFKKNESVKWLQDRLSQVKDLLPAEFNEAFVMEYKPATAKALNFTRKNNPEFDKAMDWASEVKNGSVSVSYNLVDDPTEGGDDA